VRRVLAVRQPGEKAAVGVLAEREQVEALFVALAANQVDEFLAGCSEQLLITLWGTSPLSSTISPDQLPLWLEGFHQLAEGTLVTEVLLTLADEHSHVVIVRHLFTRNGRARKFDTVNFCTLRDGALASWFSRPLDHHEYVEAWGLQRPEDRPSRTMASSRATAPTIADRLEHT
jgi:ketosteroid isomerase-like protein